VESEQKRFQRGRTTTFLVLNAENDLDDATLSVYRLIFEELLTKAQAELFNTKPIQ
jgi:outer membrane protein TolC